MTRIAPSTWGLVAFSVTANAVAQIFLRRGMAAVGELAVVKADDALALVVSPWILLGVLAFGLSFLSWLAVLSKLAVSVAYPMASLGYIVAALLGVLFLGEGVSAPRVLGLMLICAGVTLVAGLFG